MAKQASNLIAAYYGVSDEDTKKYLEQGIAPPQNNQTYINPNAPKAPQQNDLMNQLAKAQETKAVAGLKSAYDKNINAITAQEKQIAPIYEGQRSGLRADSTMQAKDFENFLANKGISASGSAGQGEIARNVSLQGGISNSKLQQQKALEDIARMKLDAKRDYESGVVSSTADIQAQLLQNQITDNIRQQDIDREDKKYQDGIKSNETANQRNEFISTLARFAANYQSEINRVKNDGDPSNDWQIPILEAARQEKIQSQGLDQQGNKLPVAPQQMTYEQALNLWKAYGIASAEIAAILGIPVGAKTADYQDMEYDINKPYFAPKTGGGGTPSVSQQTADKKAAAQQLSGDVMTYLDEWASGKAEDRNGQRADQADMINYLKANAGTLTAQGVDVNALIKWVTENYTWVR